MINISDEIKAKITIEADTSGADEAAAALEKLQGATGASAEGAGSLGDQLAAMEKQASSSAVEVAGLADETKGFVEATNSGENAVSSFNDTLGGHQQAIENTGAAYEALQEPLGAAVKQIESASSPMTALTERAQSLATQVSPVSESFSQLGDTLSQTVPMLPQFASSLHEVSQAFDPKQFGLDTFAENMSVFQDALSNPYPFSMIQSHLNETGQTWGDFTSSIGGENTAALHGMAQSASAADKSISNLNASAQETGKIFSESAGSTQAFTDQFNGMSEGINKLGGVGSSQYGPLTLGDTLAKTWGLAGNEAQKAMAQMGLTEGSSGLGGIFSSAFGDLGGVLEGASRFVMPLMALQMVGMAVQQVGQGIYDAAAIAEGSGAHGIETFTGTVDALGQTMAKSGQSFSESFGQQLLPTLNAINYQMNQGAGGGIGGFLGGLGSDIANNLMMVGGLVSMTVPGGQGIGWDMFKAGGEGMINQAASEIGLPQPFQGPGPVAQAQIDYNKQMSQIPQTVEVQTLQTQGQASTIMGEALNSNYLKSQEQLSTSQQFLQKQQASYDAAHPYSQQQALMDYRDQQATQSDQQAYAQYQANPPTYAQDIGKAIQQGDWGSVGKSISSAFSSDSGQSILKTLSPAYAIGSAISSSGSLGDIGRAFQDSAVGQDFSQMFGGAGQTIGGIGNFFSGLFGAGQQQATPYGPVGCFPAGTLVLMADNTEKPIEQLQVGESVLGYNGTRQVPTTVLARIVPPPKRVYDLTFSDGNILTLTDSHPIATLRGWASISPAHTKLENPDLEVVQLFPADAVLTADGECTLIAISPKGTVQVYNITVSEPHTFYASKVLVHNKGESMTSAGIGTESVSLAHTFRADVTWEANNLSKQFTAVANWAEQGLMHAVTAVANWTEQNVQHAITAVANWTEQNVIHPVVAAAEWTEQNVMHAVQAVANWTEQNVQHAVQAVANWTERNLVHPVTAVAQWAEKNLEHTFLGVASWAGQNLFHTFVGVAQWITQTITSVIPAFAEGVSGFSGGAAIVGEAGMEAVEHNGQYMLVDSPTFVNLPAGASVYPMQELSGSSSPRMLAQGTGGDITPIYLGSGGGGAPQTANIAIHLDSQAIISAIGIPLASSIRLGMGSRAF